MSLWSKLTGGETATPTTRTKREKLRTSREISRIDAGTTKWLNGGGIHPRKGR